MIVYVEPNENGEAITTRLTEEEAIRRTKQYASSKGHVYKNDDEALRDFMVTHWAWKEE